MAEMVETLMTLDEAIARTKAQCDLLMADHCRKIGTVMIARDFDVDFINEYLGDARQECGTDLREGDRRSHPR
jgi:hypothetical protein